MRKLVLTCAALLLVTCWFAVPSWSAMMPGAEAGMNPGMDKLMAASAVPADIRLASSTGTIKSLKGSYTLSPQKDVSDSVLYFMDTHRQSFGLSSPKDEMKLVGRNVTKQGNTHLRYQQTLNGIPVWNRQVLAKVDGNNALVNIRADYVQTPQVGTTPTITAEQAIKAAEADLTATGQMGPYMKNPSAELVIYPSMGRMILSYFVQVHVSAPAGRWFYFIDAATGSVVRSYNNIQTTSGGPISGSGTLWDSSTANIGLYNYAGTDYLVDGSKTMGNIQSSDFSFAGNSVDTVGNPFLTDGSISAWDAGNAVDGSGNGLYTNAVAPMSDPNGDGNINEGGRLTAGANVISYQGRVYDYFKNMFGRNSLDDKGGSLLGVVHFGSNYDNAYWNGYFMTYGDGGGNFTDLSQGLDVVAHEMGHGLTESMVPPASLTYMAQSGAMNEHISDLWGVMVDSSNFLLGENIMLPGNAGSGNTYDALRDFHDPADPTVMSQCPDKMADFLYTHSDQSGVHTNSGILSKAAGKMIDSLGRDAVARLYYDAYNYLTPDAHFYDLREALADAAFDLYPSNPDVMATIYESFDSVGVTVPKASEVIQYYRATDTAIVDWQFSGVQGSGYQGFGTYFVPNYSGKLTAVDAVFHKEYATISDYYVMVVVYDPSFNLVYSQPYRVAAFDTPVTINLVDPDTNLPVQIPFTDSFTVFIYPHSDQVALLSDDGDPTNDPATAPNVKGANFILYESGTLYYSGYKNPPSSADYNFKLRPHVTYDVPDNTGRSVVTLDMQQDGGKVTLSSNLYALGVSKQGLSVQYYASTDGGTTWALKGAGITKADGTASLVCTLANGTYKLKATYTQAGVGTVTSSIVDCIVAPVTLDTPANAAVVTTATPDLAWAQFAGATGYHLQVSTSSLFTVGATTTEYDIADGATLTKTLDTPLALGKLYYWRVVATWPTGNKSVYSDYRTITYKEATKLSLALVKQDGLVVTLKATLTDGYDVKLPATKTVAILEGATSKASGLTLLADGTYTANITSTLTVAAPHSFVAKFVGDTAYAPSDSSSTPVAVTVGKETLVSPATASVVTTATPDLTWTQYPGATGYVVQVSTSSLFTVGAATREVVIGDGATVTTPSPALVRGTLYYWRVVATWPTGNKTVYSDYRTITYKDATKLSLALVKQDGLVVTLKATLTDGSDVKLPVAKTVAIFEGITSKASGLTLLADGTYTATITSTITAAAPHSFVARFVGDTAYAPSDSSAVPVPVTIGKAMLDTPANAAVVTTATPDLSWVQYPGATGYVVQVSTSSLFTAGATTREVVIGAGATVTTPSPALVRGTLYYWRVVATWPTGNKTVYSDTRTITYKDATKLSLALVKQDGLVVTLRATLTDGSDVKLPVAKTVAIYEGATLKVSGLTLLADGTYTANITSTVAVAPHLFVAKFAGDTTNAPSVSSTADVTLGKVVLDTPANAAVVTTATPDLTWTHYSGTIGYVVQVSTSSLFTAGAATREVVIPSDLTLTTPSPPLTRGTLYYWRVVATWPDGNKSVYSDYRTITYKTGTSIALQMASQNGLGVTVTATLTDDSLAPLGGKVVTFYENTGGGAYVSKGTAITGAATSATPGVVNKTWTTTAGSHNAYVTFAGDATYAPASSILLLVPYTSPGP